MEIENWHTTARNETTSAIQKHEKKIWMPGADLSWTSVPSSMIAKIQKSEVHDLSRDAPIKCEAKTDKFIRAHIVHLHPTDDQKRILNGWGHSCRQMYNYTRRLINKMIDPDQEVPVVTSLDQCPKTTYFAIRAMLTKKKKRIEAKSKATLGAASCRLQTLDMMIDLAHANYQTCRSNLAIRKIRSFTMPMILAGCDKQCIKLAGRIFDQRGFYGQDKCLGQMTGIREEKGVHRSYDFSQVTRDSTLIIDRALGTYTLNVPQPDEMPQGVRNRHRFIALDPGYRTLLTGISESHALMIGDQIMLKMDKYVEKLKQLAKIRRKRTRLKKIARAKIKLHAQVDAMHWVMASYLAKNYDHVLIGDMSPVRIISKQGGLPSNYKRKMVLLRYGKFRERLEYKCHQHSAGFRIVDESFTSRACSACGFVKDKTASKIHECPSCNTMMDRDLNGARNIYCKHL